MSEMQFQQGTPAAQSRDRKFGIGSRVALSGFLAAGLIFGCMGWAAQAQLTGAVIAAGKVTVERQVKQIQHRDGGIISEILVDNGDRVSAGDVLIQLDETQTKAELGIIQLQLTESQGRRARLLAERDGLDAILFDVGFAVALESADVAAGEQRLFDNNRATRDAQRDQLSSQIEQYGEQINGLLAQRDSNGIEHSMVSEDLERVQPLVSQRLIDVAKVRSMERDLVKIGGLRGEIESSVARVKGQISEAQLKIIELDQQTRTDAQRELREVEARIGELSERVYAATDRLSRMELRAPISGFVNDLQVHTVDGVITAGQTVMGIVPEGADLIIEARLSPTDIDQVNVGQDVKLRFSAFNQGTTPQIDGRLEIVGAASSVDPVTGETYYLSTIAITDISSLGGRALIPGMPVEVFLQTGERSALSYLIKPMTDQMKRSWREE